MTGSAMLRATAPMNTPRRENRPRKKVLNPSIIALALSHTAVQSPSIAALTPATTSVRMVVIRRMMAVTWSIIGPRMEGNDEMTVVNRLTPKSTASASPAPISATNGCSAVSSPPNAPPSS